MERKKKGSVNAGQEAPDNPTVFNANAVLLPFAFKRLFGQQ